MEPIMHKPLFLPLITIALSILSGCGSMPTNSALTDAHDSYNTAQANPDVTNLAALELKQAGDTLNKADTALNKRESVATINQLAYLAKQQVGIAQETAKRKTAEQAVTQSAAKRDQMRLEARTAEADAAKQQAQIAQNTAEQRATELAAAKTQAERDQMQHQMDMEAQQAQAAAAKQQALTAQSTAEQQAAELAAAHAQADTDQARIAQQEKELKELKDLNAKQTDRGIVITLGDVLFNPGQARLKSASMRNIHKLVDFLKQYPQRNVLVEGYTDSKGSASHNQTLSEQRASAVRTTLIDNGIDADRITTRGYGEAFPVAVNDTPGNRQMNRRVEITLSDDNGKLPDARER
jgi:outer membrane protein OmpA-like peptidoglycan-associated protein